MMGDFYLSLPSNSSLETYPENRGGHFYTDLPQDIDLAGHEYEVGLSEIFFSNTYSNVFKDEIRLIIRENPKGQWVHHSLSPGLYPSTEGFVASLNKLAQSVFHSWTSVKFYHNTATKRVTLRISKDNLTLRLSPKLASLLHLEDKIYSGKMREEGSAPVDLHAESYSVFVYCDLVEHRVVGDALAPLLRIVPTVNKTAEITHQIYEKPHYIPLTKRHFNSVEILLTSDTGKELVFEGGKTMVTLHLRHSRRQRSD